MAYMLDSSAPPDDAALAAAAADGCIAWAGYVPSPGHPNGWSRDDFDRVRAHGLIPVFVDLGTSAGRIGETVAALGAQPGDAVVTDIEPYGATLSNAAAWRAAVAADGYSPWVYGTWATVNAAPAGFAVRWGAAYGANPDTVRSSECVQFENTHIEFGISVDRSAVGEGVFNMVTLDVARALTRLAYWSAGHREPDVQGWNYWSERMVRDGADVTLAAMVDAGGELAQGLAADRARDFPGA